MDRYQHLKFFILLFPLVGFVLSVAGDSPRFRQFDYQQPASNAVDHVALLENETGDFAPRHSASQLANIWGESNDSDIFRFFSSDLGVADSQQMKSIVLESPSGGGNQLGIEMRFPIQIAWSTGIGFNETEQGLLASTDSSAESAQLAGLLIENFSMAKTQFNQESSAPVSDSFNVDSLVVPSESFAPVKFVPFEDTLQK